MNFIYLKSTGAISEPIRRGKPDDRTLSKESDCGIGGGVKWDTNELFYEEDSEFPDDFQKWASTGKYYIEEDEVKENEGWEKPLEEEPW